MIRQITNHDCEFYNDDNYGVWNFISRDDLLEQNLEEGALKICEHAAGRIHPQESHL